MTEEKVKTEETKERPVDDIQNDEAEPQDAVEEIEKAIEAAADQKDNAWLTVGSMGDAEAIVVIAKRLEYMNRGAKIPPTLGECVIIAQRAAVIQANPLTEVWGWIEEKVDRDTGEMKRTLTVMAHRNFWTRKLREYGQDTGTIFAETFRYITEAEKITRGLAPKDVAVEVSITDTTRRKPWSNDMLKFCQAGVPWHEALKIVGPSPDIKAVGVFQASEKHYGKFPKHMKAEKRAFAEAVKRIITPELLGMASKADDFVNIEVDTLDVSALLEAGDVEPGEFDEIEMTRDEIAENTLGFDMGAKLETVKIERPMAGEVLQDALKRKAAKLSKKFAAAGEVVSEEDCRPSIQTIIDTTFQDKAEGAAALKYITGVTEADNIANDMAVAICRWLALDDEGIPGEHVIEELRAALKAAQVEQGQQELPLEGGE